MNHGLHLTKTTVTGQVCQTLRFFILFCLGLVTCIPVLRTVYSVIFVIFLFSVTLLLRSRLCGYA